MGSLDANGSETSARTTNLGVGASLTWGSLRVDGTVNAANGAKTLVRTTSCQTFQLFTTSNLS